MARRSKKPQRQIADARDYMNKQDGGFENTRFRCPSGVTLFSPKAEGTYRFNIVPYTVNGDTNPDADDGFVYFQRRFWQHRDIGTEGNSYICLQKTFGEKCPVCEYRKKLMQSQTADKDAIKAVAPKERQLLYIVDLEHVEEGVQLWEVSHYNFGKKLKQELRASDEEDQAHLFHDPDNGCALRVYMEESFVGKTKFYEAGSITFTPRRKGQDVTWEMVDGLEPLDNLLIKIPYDKLRAIFLEADDEEAEAEDVDDGADDDAAPAPKPKRKRKPKAKPAPEPEADDDDWDDDDWDDDDDDEPAPKAKRKPKAKPAPAADDDDWDWDDDE